MPAPLVAAIATDAASERRAQDSATFPEAATAVSMLGTHAAKWSREHFEEALSVLLWMHARRDDGIVFRRDPAFNPKNCIIAYADADLAGGPDTRRSRSGAAIMMGSTSQATCIAHRSALQKNDVKTMKEWFKSVKERQK